MLCLLLLLLQLLPTATAADAVCVNDCTAPCVCYNELSFCQANPTLDLQASVQPETELCPGTFAHASYLEHLTASDIPALLLYNQSFSGLENLQTLDLSGDMLQTLPAELLQQTPSLQQLDLSGNSLTGFPDGAFAGLNSLTTLQLSRNRITALPLDLLQMLPSLQQLSLSSNPLDCSDATSTAFLYQLLLQGILVNDTFLRCSDGQLLSQLNITLPTPSPSTAPATTIAPFTTPAPTTSTATIQRTTFAIIPTVTESISATVTETVVPTATELITATVVTASPTPLPLSCPSETATPTATGYFSWPQTQPGACVSAVCPEGPPASVAQRCCSPQGQWLQTQDSACNQAPPTTQTLARLYQVELTEGNSEAVSHDLAASLAPTDQLTAQEVATVTDILARLIQTAPTNTQVLNNTLQVVDSLVTSSGTALTSNATTTARLRAIVDTVLLAALNSNNTQLVLSFAHLAVGGAYLPGTNQSTLLTTITLHSGGEGVEVEVGGEEGEGDVQVMVEGAANGSIQVTVYEGDELFGEADCTSEGVGGTVVTPVITVTDNNAEQNSQEVVTITYNQLQSNGEVVCARWNASLNCGGGWETADCALVTSSTGALQCRCLNQGTYTVIDVPDVPVSTGGAALSLAARVVFYAVCGLSVPLYLTVLLAVLLYRHLRSLPTMQCLANLCLSQALTFVTLAVSFERVEQRWVCYSLATLLQYLQLLALSWLVVYPILIALKMFRRLWYDKSWLLVPFLLLCWVWPAIPVGVYAGVRHSGFPEQPNICWLEASVFPSMFTYLSSFTALLVLVSLATVALMLLCSDYTVEAAVYLQLASLFGNFLLYFGVVLTQFFTASSERLTDYLLFVAACLIASCAVFFFATNALLKSRIRSAILRKKDPVLSQKVAHYSSAGDSEQTSQTSIGGGGKFRRAPVRLTDDLNINYVDDYLGGPQRVNPVPLSLFHMVQPEGGRVGRVGRGGGEMAAAGFTNPAYHFQQTSQV